MSPAKFFPRFWTSNAKIDPTGNKQLVPGLQTISRTFIPINPAGKAKEES
jgi:hypothetical protein